MKLGINLCWIGEGENREVWGIMYEERESLKQIKEGIYLKEKGNKIIFFKRVGGHLKRENKILLF